ncbi:DNA-protecting protein DprA [Brenneria goodwinii]|uniref:Putative DNA processing chain A n=1 Tax=Brenneria goodwinii TaxID=1109412 RepID=A0A0G4JX61_9GAMM|nr:DNA-processing protein DprA [Brenneria goodwinii]MCG8156794.1 DNA-protecting protein DprA [Brenneria goodwinii]MCG8160274.1 DNA-protecting protein DprA [Brenneria goodwinii]MCG8164797.1 DNA-protecting protein DprA [Brenneria goodwinii]MCG8172305.1 DNA-protecting protein DprA [Brenneria goodwinii]MCG8174024.1 DNA-protecting protein DprA [Brenneria goodwinii]
MNLSSTAQAILLLTSYFSPVNGEEVKPLTNAEWGRFALWLKEKKITPAGLLVADPKPLLSGWHDQRVSIERILLLLNRGHSLALAVEKWQRAGLWVITRSDPEYPQKLKDRLKTDSPPVLFGCGNKSLLQTGGIAIVGSRNAGIADLTFTEQLGAKAASHGISIISGGARGVDEAAMLGAMHSGGNVIGVIADSLLKAATSSKWRKGLMHGQMVLISPFYPESGFSTGNAMARNKYIYCLSDTSVVVHSGMKGGTLNGAEENLKRQWVPLWVKPTNDRTAANELLVAKGGQWCREAIEQLDPANLLLHSTTSVEHSGISQPELFPSNDSQPDLPAENTGNMPVFSDIPSYKSNTKEENLRAKTLEETSAPYKPIDFYQLFLGELERLAITPKQSQDLIQATSLNKSQVEHWLKRALEEGYVKKLNRPQRYQWIGKEST